MGDGDDVSDIAFSQLAVKGLSCLVIYIMI
jgi:hypothetical protein